MSRRLTSELEHAKFLRILRRRVASLSIGASALRNQGAGGVIIAAREFLTTLDPTTFVVSDEKRFHSRLDKATARLQAKFPPEATSWGAARKAVNLFLRDVLYNTYLAESYGMSSVRHWLELPLDSYTARALQLKDHSLPRWLGVKYLQQDESDKYQEAATTIAKAMGIARVDLDVLYWRKMGTGD